MDRTTDEHEITGAQIHGAHPAATLFPALRPSDQPFKDLVEDIKQQGLLERITVIRDGEHYQILDGRNRFEACKAAHVPAVFTEYTSDDPYGYVASKNLHRRHLTPGQKRSVVAALLKAKPEKSNLAVARQAGVSDKTVAAQRERMEVNSEIPNTTERQEASGRRARGRKPASKPASRGMRPKRGTETVEDGNVGDRLQSRVKIARDSASSVHRIAAEADESDLDKIDPRTWDDSINGIKEAIYALAQTLKELGEEF